MEEFLGLVFEIVFQVLGEPVFKLLFGTGWLVSRIVTLGHYPPDRDNLWTNEQAYSKGFVAFIGFLFWLAVAIYGIGLFR